MEATPTDSTPVATDTGEASSKAKQPRIPSVHATSFRKATDTTRNVVIARDNRKCWLCGIGWEPNLDVAHNIGASIPLGRLEIWKGLGILPEVFYPAHVDNLILLCKNCHSAYDCEYPGWIMFPQNLDLFIKFENDDYAARTAVAKHGVRQGRALSKIDRTNMLCQPYVLDPGFTDDRPLDWSRFPKQFLGCPQTIILKALAACFCPGQSVEKFDIHGNVIYTGVPATVLGKAQKLVVLWNRSDPKVVAGQSGQKRRRGSKDDDAQDDENDENDSGEDLKGKDSKNFSKSHPNHSSGNSGRGHGSPAAKDRPHGTGLDSRNSAESKKKRNFELAKGLNDSRSYENLDGNEMRDEEKFVLGPEKTAADIMLLAEGWRRTWELDEAAWRARM